MEWAVRDSRLCVRYLIYLVALGMGTLHAWESFGDGIAVSLVNCPFNLPFKICIA